MIRSRKGLFLALAAALCLTGVNCGSSDSAINTNDQNEAPLVPPGITPSEGYLTVGTAAPEFTGTTIEGANVSLSEMMAQGPVVLSLLRSLL